MLKFTRPFSVFVIAMSVLPASPTIAEQSVADFYKEKTISITISFGEGGAYDLYGRLLSQFLPKYIPGHPTVIVQHMPGGAGIRGANFIANVAAKDGSQLAMLSDYAAITQVLQSKSVSYDASKFRYIGSVTTVNYAVMAWHTSPIKTIDDAKAKPSVFGATGRASQNYTTGAILNAVIGTKFKLVAGYRGSSDMSLAMERGEIHVQNAAWMSWKARQANWIAEKKIIPLVQIGLRKDPDLPQVPLLLDLAKNSEDRRLLWFTSSSASVGRSLLAPPGIPEDRLAVLRQAFQAVMKDSDFLAAAAKSQMSVIPVAGPELESIAKETIAVPASIADRVRSAVQGN